MEFAMMPHDPDTAITLAPGPIPNTVLMILHNKRKRNKRGVPVGVPIPMTTPQARRFAAELVKVSKIADGAITGDDDPIAALLKEHADMLADTHEMLDQLRVINAYVDLVKEKLGIAQKQEEAGVCPFPQRTREALEHVGMLVDSIDNVIPLEARSGLPAGVIDKAMADALENCPQTDDDPDPGVEEEDTLE